MKTTLLASLLLLLLGPMPQAQPGSDPTPELGPTPISLLYFRGESMSSGSYLLEWVSVGIQPLFFYIEESTDGVQFTNTGQVESKGYEGNFYHSFEATPEHDAIMYYRIWWQEAGETLYSKVIVRQPTNKKLDPYLIPEKAGILVAWGNTYAHTVLAVYDTKGILVAKITSSQQEVFFETISWVAGCYIIRWEQMEAGSGHINTGTLKLQL